jgi:hypothetical protein
MQAVVFQPFNPKKTFPLMKLLKFNEPITFGSKGTIHDYVAAGWALGEENPSMTWTEQIEARVEFNTQSTTSPVRLRMSGLPFLAEGKVDSQEVWVHLNGMYCGAFNADKQFDVNVPIQGGWLEPRGNVLTLTMPLAKSPKALGLNNDQRVLGVALNSIALNLV